MIQWPRRSRISPIGLEVDGRSFAAVQLSGRPGEPWRLSAATVLPRTTPQPTPDAAEVERLSEVLRRQGFTGTSLVLAAPNEKLLTGVLDLPPASAQAPFDQIARMELARMHKCEPDTFEMSYWELPARQRHASGGQETDRRQANAPRNVMAAACSVADAAPLLDVFEEQGWDVQAMDVQSWAMLRACAVVAEGGAKTGESSAALLSFGWNGALLVLRHHNIVVYQRILDEAGVNRLHAAIMEHAHVNAEMADLILFRSGLPSGDGAAAPPMAIQSRSVAEARRIIAKHLDAIVREVRTSCSYMGHRHADAAPKLLLMMGEGAAMPGIDAHLAHELEMDVKVMTASALAFCPPTLAAFCNYPRGSALVTAMGLAMWGDSAAIQSNDSGLREAA